MSNPKIMYTARELCKIYDGCQYCVRGHLYFQTLFKCSRCHPVIIKLQDWANLWKCARSSAQIYEKRMIARGYIQASRHNAHGMKTYSLVKFPK